MISLHRRELPASKDEFAQALDEELRRHVRKMGPLVDVRSRVFPFIDEIAVNLDGAQIDSISPSAPTLARESKPAFEIALVNVSARNVRLRDMPLDLRFEARDVLLRQDRDANGNIVLFTQKIRDGEVSFSAAQLDLEEVLAKLIRDQAGAHGITIEQVRLALRERGPRSVGAEVRLQARKLFVRAKIDIYGQIDIDENFVATISQLRCQGTGAIASRACSALEPHLQRFNGKSFSLKSLPLGETQLRDLRLAITDTVEINIGFGSDQTET